MPTPYRVIIAGSRDFSDYALLSEKCDSLLSRKRKTHSIVIVSGAARGADTLGEQYARERGYAVESHRPDWNTYGKAAGFRRNAEMAQDADALIAFWDGQSRGTRHMIEQGQKKGLQVRIIRLNQN